MFASFRPRKERRLQEIQNFFTNLTADRWLSDTFRHIIDREGETIMLFKRLSNEIEGGFDKAFFYSHYYYRLQL